MPCKCFGQVKNGQVWCKSLCIYIYIYILTIISIRSSLLQQCQRSACWYQRRAFLQGNNWEAHESIQGTPVCPWYWSWVCQITVERTGADNNRCSWRRGGCRIIFHFQSFSLRSITISKVEWTSTGISPRQCRLQTQRIDSLFLTLLVYLLLKKLRTFSTASIQRNNQEFAWRMCIYYSHHVPHDPASR